MLVISGVLVAFWFSCTMNSDCHLEIKCPVLGPPGGRRLGCFCDLSVFGAGTGLYPSLNCEGGGNMRSSYSLTICLTILHCLGIVSLVLGAGTGLYPSLNCGGGGNMRSSYLLTICLILLLDLGTGFLIVSLVQGAGIGLKVLGGRTGLESLSTITIFGFLAFYCSFLTIWMSSALLSFSRSLLFISIILDISKFIPYLNI